MRDSEKLKKLSAYRKDEIIEALGNSYNFDYIAGQMLDYLENRKAQELIDRHGKAVEKEHGAQKAYFLWRKEMCEKYGDGRTVSIKDIPGEEIMRGAELEREWNEARETERRLDKQVNKMLMVGD